MTWVCFRERLKVTVKKNWISYVLYFHELQKPSHLKVDHFPSMWVPRFEAILPSCPRRAKWHRPKPFGSSSVGVPLKPTLPRHREVQWSFSNWCMEEPHYQIDLPKLEYVYIYIAKKKIQGKTQHIHQQRKQFQFVQSTPLATHPGWATDVRTRSLHQVLVRWPRASCFGTWRQKCMETKGLHHKIWPIKNQISWIKSTLKPDV